MKKSKVSYFSRLNSEYKILSRILYRAFVNGQISNISKLKRYLMHLKTKDFYLYKTLVKKGIQSGKISVIQSLESFIVDLPDKELNKSLSKIAELDIIRSEFQNGAHFLDILQTYEYENIYLKSIYNKIKRKTIVPLKNAIFKYFREENYEAIIEIFHMNLINILSKKDIKRLLNDNKINLSGIIGTLKIYLPPEQDFYLSERSLEELQDYLWEYPESSYEDYTFKLDEKGWEKVWNVYLSIWRKIEKFLETCDKFKPFPLIDHKKERAVLVPRSVSEFLEEGDSVEIKSGIFEGKRALVIRMPDDTSSSEEVVIRLLQEDAPITIKMHSDYLKIVEKREILEENTLERSPEEILTDLDEKIIWDDEIESEYDEDGPEQYQSDTSDESKDGKSKEE